MIRLAQNYKRSHWSSKKGSLILRFRIQILFFCFGISTQALSFELNHRWELSGTVQSRELFQQGFSDYQQVTDGFAMIALDQTIKKKSWLLEVRPELRILYSETIAGLLNDTAKISLVNKNRVLQLQKEFVQETNDQKINAVLDIEKINLRYQGAAVEMILGRNPLNPSILRLAPIWNKFNRDLFFTGYPNFIFNPDMAAIKLSGSSSWIQALQVNKDTSLILAGLQFDQFESQILFGKMFEEKTWGFNLSLSTEESLWKAELLSVLGDQVATNRHTEFSLAHERAWTDSYSTTLEFIYSDLFNNFENAGDFYQAQSPFLALRNKYYVALQMDYQFSDTWAGSFTPVINLQDSSLFQVLALRAQISDNFEIISTLKASIGSRGSEFSSQSYEVIPGQSLGLTNTAYVMAKYFF